MILKNCLAVDGAFELKSCDIQIENGIIAVIGENLTGGETADMNGCYVLPGFIDSHMHGAMGCKLSDTNPLPDLHKITQYEATQGVTSIALGSTCSDFDHLLRIQTDTCILGYIHTLHDSGADLLHLLQGKLRIHHRLDIQMLFQTLPEKFHLHPVETAAGISGNIYSVFDTGDQFL